MTQPTVFPNGRRSCTHNHNRWHSLHSRQQTPREHASIPLPRPTKARSSTSSPNLSKKSKPTVPTQPTCAPLVCWSPPKSIQTETKSFTSLTGVHGRWRSSCDTANLRGSTRQSLSSRHRLPSTAGFMPPRRRMSPRCCTSPRRMQSSRQRGRGGARVQGGGRFHGSLEDELVG